MTWKIIKSAFITLLGTHTFRKLQKLNLSYGVSGVYRPLDLSLREGGSDRLRDAWRGQLIPQRQRKLVNKQLKAFRAGKNVDVFDTFVAALKTLPGNVLEGSLLEVGCSSGYYSEVLEISNLNFKYHGCDYSKNFVELANKIYPNVPFDVADAAALKYEDAEFDVVVSGCCLLHMLDYESGIREAARVSKSFVIFSRTPVVSGSDTLYFTKRAYGVETIEIHFNEIEFLSTLKKYRLEVISEFTLSESVVDGITSSCRTYVCQKK